MCRRDRKKPRRGRPPKAEKAEQAAPEADKEQTAAKPRRGRPPKADKAAPDEAQPPKPRDKVSQGKKAATVKAAPAPEQATAGGGAGPEAGIAAEPDVYKRQKQSYHITQKAARSRPRAAFLRGKLGRRQDFSKK